jgi:hypothetical protein
MIGRKITSLEVHLEMRIDAAGGANGGFLLVAATVSKPASSRLPLRVVSSYAGA